ncbi:hypothetical protein [uncultured Psychrosphaera sp.]|uniref:hypothetical protein n=1 Tax=uncultured Psychrosphaera sp. TaxID=1403522 RepID=UPI00261407E5|nr:hypothetical protein [uncultured Psychrosphaera sp.]
MPFKLAENAYAWRAYQVDDHKNATIAIEAKPHSAISAWRIKGADFMNEKLSCGSCGDIKTFTYK